MDITRDIESLTHFKRNTTAVIEQLKATGEPLVLTVNGRAEVIVQDAAAYQRMLDIVDRAEAIVGIKKGLGSMEEGRGIPLQEAASALRRQRKSRESS